ncbi:MAG: flagellar assembly protein FliW [Anaeromusa sp.]|uniref:flagellar assembly protein FliW n=1 Tax=Anaeromusa sp. TaxID=1872520 RepID=UPI002B1EA197|nr:flagellar assembly protein FliW [Anaeromusa sp.]MEA4836081.1 flagellar assembly protein FliW [Anaeromusa sp.]
MKIQSTRFGELNVSEDDVIYFSKGLPGFAEEQRFALLPQGEESPFFFLQSTQDPNLTFLLVDPFSFFKEYHFEIDDKLVVQLGLSSEQPPMALCIVNVPQGKTQDMTANLSAPIIINRFARLGRQVVLTDTSYSLRQRLYLSKEEGGQ